MIESPQRMTRQRTVLLETLRRMKTHPTADELFHEARNDLPRISLGTVYRNLDMLSEMNLIRKLEYGGGRMRFDGDMGEHYHIRCVKCGRIDDIPVTEIAGIDCVPNRLAGYKVLDFSLHINGICPACAETGEVTEIQSGRE